MKLRPILFSAPMVRALFDGTKTQTRRVVKDPRGLYAHLGDKSVHPAVASIEHVANGEFAQRAKSDAVQQQYITTFPFHRLRCPYGQPGDRLWVKETFAHWSARELFGAGMMPTTVFRAGRPVLRPPPGPAVPLDQWDRGWSDDVKPADLKWTPSIHMPRRLSRITLEVTAVRAERLQDISGADAVAEGVQSQLPDNGVAQSQFADLWQSINGPASWVANPWVWAVSFRRVEQAHG